MAASPKAGGSSRVRPARLLLTLAVALLGPVALDAQGVTWYATSTRITQTFALAESGAARPWLLPSGSRFPSAEYPVDMIQAGMFGRVVFTCSVTTNGRVRDVRVLEATTPEFRDSAQRALARWRFHSRPAKESSVRLVCTFLFELPTE